jgi:hypothetical protein
LERLDLAYTNVTDDTALSLAAIKTLAEVDLTHTLVTASAAEELKARLPNLQISPAFFPRHGEEQAIVQELGTLGVRLGADPEGRVIEVDAREATNQSRVVQLVRQLSRVSMVRMGPTCGDADLEGLGDVSTLVEVNLRNSKISDRIVDELRRLPQLKRLDLAHTAIGDAAGAAIATLHHLVMLQLSDTMITDATLEQLAGLKQLQQLYVDGANVGARGLEALHRLTALKHLSVRRVAGLTDSDIDRLQRAISGCRIIRFDTR